MSSAICNNIAGVTYCLAKRSVERNKAMAQKAVVYKRIMSLVNKPVHAAGGEGQIFHLIA
jgi:hypothetical protein